jgi:hypothetical protein
MDPIENCPNPLSIELLDTTRCLPLSREINDFENSIFGPDFFCEFETIRHWVESGSLFCAAVCGQAVEGRPSILAVASVFLTNLASRDRVMRGEIHDVELAPWFRCTEHSQPVAYFSSIISSSPEHLGAMYRSLGQDLLNYLGSYHFSLHSAFSIAAGQAGLRHMLKSGFSVVEGCKYMQQYDIMIMDGTAARTAFWRDLLQTGDPSLERHTTLTSVNPETGDGRLLPEEDAKSVERRLVQAKAARYRSKMSY